jgi:hypothetical protein
MKPLVFTVSSVVALSSIIACSSNDAAPAPEKKDVQLACNDMCEAASFSSAKKDDTTSTVSCYCAVGNASAKVEATMCTKFCTDIGKGQGTPFGSNAGGNPDSCKCG